MAKSKKRKTSTPYKDGEVLAITYDVWISGTKLSMTKKECISSIEIKETVDGSDTAQIKISDPEFLYIDDNIFIEENTIKIKLGWSNTTYRVQFNGYISAIDIEFASNGIPQLTITCMDNTHKMNRKKKNATFFICISAEVVKKIVKNYGFTCVVDSSYKFEKQETITQSDQTDIDFIQKLAQDEVYPFTARLVGNTFYYVKKGKLGTPKMTLTYRDFPHEVISFSPKLNKETKKEEIKSATVKSSNKSVSKSTGTVKSSKGSVSSGSNTNEKNGKESKKTYTYNPATKKWS